jgi:hypothetical protein
MNLNGFGRKRPWPNFKVLTRHSSGGTEEIHDNLCQDSRFPCLNLYPGPPEYEAGVLTIRLRRTILWLEVIRISFQTKHEKLHTQVLNRSTMPLDVWGVGMFTHMPNHGSRWRCMISFATRPLYPEE